ncbi:DUF2225 domain-containing protein [Metabacillus mangrovi]|uniref:DUF2225 domain-containing protein n=1 Tax=Metabacillus mangrovi TaxID=1491830 RepID=UPI0030C85273
MDHLYDKKASCTLCNTSFITKKLRSSFIRVQSSDTDFYSRYSSEIYNPLYYYASVCPNCGFSFTDEFSLQAAPSSRKQLTELVWKRWTKKDYCGERTIHSALVSHKLALYCAGLKQETHAVKAGVNHRLAWLYRFMENGEQEKRFLQQALNEYLQSYMHEDYAGTKMTDMRILYLIGELSRRLGQDGQAVRYFSRMIESQSDSHEKGLIEMAKDRWQEMRSVKGALQSQA